jgi:hypothetical protein
MYIIKPRRLSLGQQAHPSSPRQFYGAFDTALTPGLELG